MFTYLDNPINGNHEYLYCEKDNIFDIKVEGQVINGFANGIESIFD